MEQNEYGLFSDRTDNVGSSFGKFTETTVRISVPQTDETDRIGRELIRRLKESGGIET